MAQLEIDDSTARRLNELAECSNRSIDDAMPDDAHGRASYLLEAAKKMNYSSGETDISERSREILNSEFGKYLEDNMSSDA